MPFNYRHCAVHYGCHCQEYKNQLAMRQTKQDSLLLIFLSYLWHVIPVCGRENKLAVNFKNNIYCFVYGWMNVYDMGFVSKWYNV